MGKTGARPGHAVPFDSEVIGGACFAAARGVIAVTARRAGGSYIRHMASEKNDRSAWLQGPSAPCKNVRDTLQIPWRIVLLGAPGVGKGTQADLLHKRLRACHLSTGDVFRAAGGQKECDRSPAMQQALAYMRRGELVPDATVWEMVRERGECLLCAGGFILDGFPRTLAQAEALKKFMDDEGLSLSAVVNYELAEAEIVTRLGGRRTCENCKAVYHVTERPPKVEGQCDRCRGKLFQREDDRPESIRVRLEAYNRSTAPLIEFYGALGRLVRIPANGSAEEICLKTVSELEAKRDVELDYVEMREF